MGTVDGVNSLMAQTDLVNTCGSNPSWICERMFEWTNGNRVVGPLVDAVDHGWRDPPGRLDRIAADPALLRPRRRPDDGSRPDCCVRHISKLGNAATELVVSPMGIDDVPDPRRDARITSISAVIGSTSTVIIWSIALVMALGELGIELAPLIAGLGIAGVALGFGAQSLVKDCIAGLFMLLEDQYGIGDVVDLDEAVGVVEQISLRTTVLRGVDGTVWHVPTASSNGSGTSRSCGRWP